MIPNTEQLVKQRIMNQLVTSLIYENIVHYEVSQDDQKATIIIDAGDITYHATVKEAFSFQRLTLQSSVLRCNAKGKYEATVNYAQLLREVEYTFPKNTEKIEAFIQELLQTELKDRQALQYKEGSKESITLTFDALESYASEGHPYHPSYKSRLGFTLEDNLRYGPDFKPEFTIKWLAIPQQHIERTLATGIEPEQLLAQQLDATTYRQFQQTIIAQGNETTDYGWLPVHPWQFEHIIATDLAEEWLNGDIIYLGESVEQYRPQQSIRTLAPVDTTKYYIKVPLSITNTSTKRILAPHTIGNAAQITDWLKQIQAVDSYLQDDLQTIFLGEIMGMSYQSPTANTAKQQATYGALAVIWRENLHHYLSAQEDAIPFNALYSKEKDGRPLIDEWMQRYGVATWTQQFIKVAVQPIIHMLYYHGIALESHAQNMMLIHEDGWPTRVAIKDFHDGIRFKRDLLSDMASDPQLQDTPEEHKKINSNSFIETENVALVRDFVLDAFFFINISEIIMFIEAHYALDQRSQWEYVYAELEAYRRKYPNLANYAHFDLCESTIQVEKLTTRRLLEDTELRIHHVSNPLGVIAYDDIITQK